MYDFKMLQLYGTITMKKLIVKIWFKSDLNLTILHKLQITFTRLQNDTAFWSWKLDIKF